MRVVLTCLLATALVAAIGCGSGDRKDRDAAPGAGPAAGPAAGPGPAAPGPSSAALEGTYQVVRVGVNGEWTDPGSNNAEAVIKGNTFTLLGGPWGRNPGAVYSLKTNA